MDSPRSLDPLDWSERCEGDGHYLCAQCCHRAVYPYEGESEHPEDYDGPCYCNLCLSYGD